MIGKRRYSTKRLISTTIADEIYQDIKKKDWKMSQLLAIGYRERKGERVTQQEIDILKEQVKRLENANRIMQGRLLQEADARDQILKKGLACPNCGLKHH